MSKKDEALELAQDLRALADRFSEGWHEGIEINVSDIMLLSDAAEALAEQPAQHEPVALDVTVVDVALQEMAETESDLSTIKLSDDFRMQLERIRLDIGVSPHVNLTEDMIRWVLLAHKRATLPAQQAVGHVIVKTHSAGNIVDFEFDFDAAEQLSEGKHTVYTSPQPAQQEPVAWRFTGIAGLKRYMTQKQYDAQTPETKKWYEPFKCANCTTSPPASKPLTDEQIKLATEAVDQIMEQAQVFASAWSLVGGRFDFGNAMEDAEQAKAELEVMVESLAREAAHGIKGGA